MLPQCSHISCKRGVYYYRRRLPQHPNHELTLSLRTRSFREAQWLAAKLDQEFRKVITSVSNNRNPAEIQRIAREYLKDKLEHDMEQREGSPQRPIYNVFSETSPSAADLQWVEAELETAKTELRERLFDHQRPLIDEIIEAHSVPPELRGALAHAILEANVEFWGAVRRRTLGDFSEPHITRPAEPSRIDGHKAPCTTAPLLSKTLPSGPNLTFESWEGFPPELDTWESGVCETEFPSLSSPVIVAV